MILALVGIVVGLASAFGQFISNAFDATKESFDEARTQAYAYKTEFFVALVVFGIGTVFIDFQEDIMVLTDQTYECFIWPSLQVIFNLVLNALRQSWEWFTLRWNDVVIYLVNCLNTFIDEIKALANTTSLNSITEIVNFVWNFLICLTRWIIDVPSIQIPYFTQIINSFWGTLWCIPTLIKNILIDVARGTTFSEDCRFCAFYRELQDPSLFDTINPPRTCQIMILTTDPSVFPDCQHCHNYIADLGQCAASFADLVTLDLINAYIDGLIGVVVCFFGLWERPLFVVIGVIDTIANGNPPCIDTSSGKDIATEILLFIGDVLSCLDELLCFITTGSDTGSASQCGFFTSLYNSFVNAIFVIADGIQGMIDCMQGNDPAFPVFDCFDEYPKSGPGTCMCDETGCPQGLRTCIQILDSCLLQFQMFQPFGPTTVGNPEAVSVFAFVEDIFLFLDTAVCPFVLIIQCFSQSACSPDCHLNLVTGQCPCDLKDCGDKATGVFTCISADIKFLAPLSDIIKTIVSAIFSVITVIVDILVDVCIVLYCIDQRGIACVIACITNVGNTGCSSGFLRESGARTDQVYDQSVADLEWMQHLTSANVSRDTYCGEILHSTHPHVYVKDGLNSGSSAYYYCLALYASSVRLQRDNPDMFPNHNDFFSWSSLPSAMARAYTAKRDKGWQMDLDYVQGSYGPTKTHFIRNKNTTGPGWLSSSIEFVRNVTNSIVPEPSQMYPPVSNGSMPPAMLFKSVAYTLWYKWHTSEYAAATYEFGNEMFAIKKRYGDETVASSLVIRPRTANEAAIDPRSAMQYEIAMAYTRFRNRFMRQYFKDMPRVSFSSKQTRAHINGTELSFVHTTSDVTFADMFMARNELSQTKEKVVKYYDDLKTYYVENNVTRTLNQVKNISEIVIQRYDMWGWPRVQASHALYHTVVNGKWDDYARYLDGKKEYLVEEGFVSKKRYAESMDARRLDLNGSLYDRIVSAITENRTAIVTGPFLLPIDLNALIPNFNSIVARTLQMREYRLSKKVERLEARRQAAASTFDFNDFVVNVVDFFIWMFFRVEAFLAGIINQINSMASDSSFIDNIRSEMRRIVVDGLSCHFPQDIDGTNAFNPFCTPLLYQGFFVFAPPLPHGKVGTQIQWPAELYDPTEPKCVNEFTGNPHVFTFAVQNNCGRRGTQNRPDCPFCDYCPNHYLNCVDFGWHDALDSILYGLALIPRLLNGYFHGAGLDIASIEPFAILFVATYTVVALSPIYLLITMPALFLALWFSFVIFGNAPVGLIFVVVTIGMLYYAPGWLTSSLLILLSLLIADFSWLISLVFTLPSADFSIIQWLITVSEWGQIIPIINLFPWAALIVRLEHFDYDPSQPIPDIDSFCVLWTFGNLGFGWVASFTLYILFILTWRPILVFLVWIGDNIWVVILGSQAILSENAQEELETRQDKLEVETTKAIGTLASHVVVMDSRVSGMERFMESRLGFQIGDWAETPEIQTISAGPRVRALLGSGKEEVSPSDTESSVSSIKMLTSGPSGSLLDIINNSSQRGIEAEKRIKKKSSKRWLRGTRKND